MLGTSRWIVGEKDRTVRSISSCVLMSREISRILLTLIFFFLHASHAFMILIKCACSLCSFVLVPLPAVVVTSIPSFVIMEKPGRRASSTLAFLMSFFAAFLVTRAAPSVRVGGVMLGTLIDPYPESPKVAEEAGDGVKMGGEKPEDWDSIGDCSRSMKGKISYYQSTINDCPEIVP